METFVQGWGLTVGFCAVIVIVWAGAMLHLAGELRWVRVLTDHLGYELVAEEGAPAKPGGGLDLEVIRDEAHAIVEARDPAWALKQVRSWQMRAQRLEHALAFWTDLLRQMGLLGTVLGLGMSLAYTGKDVSKLLGPLAFKVWTTVAGLACSLVLTAIFGMKLPAWVDACEKNLEAWDARRRARAPRAATER
jgi:hypothetical protein